MVYLGVEPKIGVVNPPKWMVKIMENPYEQMDDLGGKHPLFFVFQLKRERVFFPSDCFKKNFGRRSTNEVGPKKNQGTIGECKTPGSMGIHCLGTNPMV